MLASLISFYYFCNHKYQYIEEKKIVIIMMMALMMPAVSNAQNDAAKKLTKFEQTTSKTGRISKFVDVRMPSKLSSTCKRRRHANTTKCFAVPIVQWTLSWMVCQSVCSFANEDARETGMGC